jgi:broad specificity phosphatase PhoE
MVKIILVRHAESIFNSRVEQIKEKWFCKDHIPKSEYESLLKQAYTETSPDLINTKLTEKGHTQSHSIAETLQARYPNLKIVLVSPMRRTMQTLEQSLKTHSKFDSLKIQFLENLREALMVNCDMGIWQPHMKSDLEFLDRYDWSFFDKFQNPDFWFIENCSAEQRAELEALLEGTHGLDQQTEKLAHYLCKDYPCKKFESHKGIYERVQKCKDEIWGIVNSEGYGDGEVLVVSHNRTLKVWLCEVFREDWSPDPKVSVSLKNCEIVEYELDCN